MADTVHAYVQEHGINDENISIIIEKMARLLYEKPEYYGFSNSDELSDIFAHYWKRINSAVKNYKYRGARFETFFIRTLQFLRINCSRSKLKFANYDYSIIHDMMQDSRFCVMEKQDVIEYNRKSLTMFRKIFAHFDMKNSRTLKSRIEMLCLKCGLYIDQQELKLICNVAKIPESKMMHLIMLANVKFSDKKAKYEKLNERRNALWLRLMNMELKLKAQSDDFIRDVMAEKMISIRKSYHRSVEKIHKYKLDLSNSEIAELLEIPKATVDSGLLRLQKQIKKSNTDMSLN